jgi:hypothetical protein
MEENQFGALMTTLNIINANLKDEKQFATLISVLNSVNANLRDMKKILKTINDDNELIKVHMKRMNKKETSSDIYNQVSPQ